MSKYAKPPVSADYVRFNLATYTMAKASVRTAARAVFPEAPQHLLQGWTDFDVICTAEQFARFLLTRDAHIRAHPSLREVNSFKQFKAVGLSKREAQRMVNGRGHPLVVYNASGLEPLPVVRVTGQSLRDLVREEVALAIRHYIVHPAITIERKAPEHHERPRTYMYGVFGRDPLA